MSAQSIAYPSSASRFRQLICSFTSPDSTVTYYKTEGQLMYLWHLQALKPLLPVALFSLLSDSHKMLPVRNLVRASVLAMVYMVSLLVVAAKPSLASFCHFSSL